MLHEYETIIIARPDMDDGAVFAIAEKIEAIVLGAEGHVLDREDWGKRKLAYLIKLPHPLGAQQRGHYLRLNYICPASLLAEIERRIRNEDNVMRFMTVRLADTVDIPTRVEEAAIERSRREEETKRREAEAALGLGDDEDDRDFDAEDDDENETAPAR